MLFASCFPLRGVLPLFSRLSLRYLPTRSKRSVLEEGITGWQTFLFHFSKVFVSESPSVTLPSFLVPGSADHFASSTLCCFGTASLPAARWLFVLFSFFFIVLYVFFPSTVFFLIVILGEIFSLVLSEMHKVLSHLLLAGVLQKSCYSFDARQWHFLGSFGSFISHYLHNINIERKV